MIAGRKLMRFGCLLFSLPLILISVLISVYAFLSGGQYRANIPLNIVVAVLSLLIVISFLPMFLGLVKLISEAIARKREDGIEK
jgi:hypothetical protein